MPALPRLLRFFPRRPGPGRGGRTGRSRTAAIGIQWVAGALALPGPAHAADTRAYFSPMLSYVVADSARGTDDGYGTTLALGLPLAGACALELNGVYQRYSENRSGGNGGAELLGGGLALRISPFARDSGLYGLVSAQYGHTQNLPGRPDDDSGFYSAGIGYWHPLNAGGPALRLEALWRHDDASPATTGGGFDDVVVNIGLAFPLGTSARAGADTGPVEVIGLGDGDADGIADEHDRCPQTPAGRAVDAQGCPSP